MTVTEQELAQERLQRYQDRRAEAQHTLNELPQVAQEFVKCWGLAVELWGRCHGTDSLPAFIRDVAELMHPIPTMTVVPEGIGEGDPVKPVEHKVAGYISEPWRCKV